MNRGRLVWAVVATLTLGGCSAIILEPSPERPIPACRVWQKPKGQQQEAVVIVGQIDADTFWVRFIQHNSKYYGQILPVRKEDIKFVGCWHMSSPTGADQRGFKR